MSGAGRTAVLPLQAELFLAQLPSGEQKSCSYLPEQLAQHQQFYWFKDQGLMPGALYQELMDRHFRRAGRLFYRPRCVACRACLPLRIAVNDFTLRHSQRRVMKKNQHLVVRWGEPSLDETRLMLYQRYVASRHPRELEEAPVPDQKELESFLYDSPVPTLEGSYWWEGRLVGIGICDVTPVALSSVYFFYEPELGANSLGVFSALSEIQHAASLGLPFYYLGYWVEGCRKMEYKASFGDHELLRGRRWVRTPVDFGR